MSNKGLVLKQNISNIAEEIRQSLGISTTYKPRELAQAIHNAILKYKQNNPTSTSTDGILTNAYDVPMVDYELDGKSEQDGEPSPDYPQEIRAVGDLVTSGEHAGKYEIPVRVRGKNLLPSTLNSETVNGVTITRNADGSITLNGTATDYFDVMWFSGELTLPAGLYYVGLNKSISPNNLYYRVGNQNIVLSVVASANYYEMNLSTTTTIVRLSTWVTPNRTFNNETFYPMICTSLPFTYEPYHSPITTPIYLDRPLYNLANGIKDKIRFSTGKRTNAIGEKVLNGSETGWATTSYNRFYCNSLFEGIKSELGAISNYFVLGNTETANNTFGISPAGRIYIRNDSQATLNDFKNWLSTHNTQVLYELDTPTEESIDLPQLNLWEGTNIIEIGTEVQPSSIEYMYIIKKDSAVQMAVDEAIGGEY